MTPFHMILPAARALRPRRIFARQQEGASCKDAAPHGAAGGAAGQAGCVRAIRSRASCDDFAEGSQKVRPFALTA